MYIGYYLQSTRLQYNCALHYDISRCNIIDNSLCLCGKPEDTYHYILTRMRVLEML